jgi:hypothetical protein
MKFDIWSIAFYGARILTLSKVRVYYKYLESFEK